MRSDSPAPRGGAIALPAWDAMLSECAAARRAKTNRFCGAKKNSAATAINQP